MSFTYKPHEMRPLDQVRLNVGDTDQHDILLQDEEIKHIIDTTSTLRVASANACVRIAAKFARRQKTQIRGETVELNTVMGAYLRLSRLFRDTSLTSAKLWAVVTKEQKRLFSDDRTLLPPGIIVNMTEGESSINRGWISESDA